MDWSIWMFLTAVVVVFGIAMIALGIFSAYFGKGRSRTFGLIMALVGAIAFGVWIWLVNWSTIEPFCTIFDDLWTFFLDGIFYLVAILVGILAAAGIFLVAVLKS